MDEHQPFAPEAKQFLRGQAIGKEVSIIVGCERLPQTTAPRQRERGGDKGTKGNKSNNKNKYQPKSKNG